MDTIRGDATCYIYFDSASDVRGRLWVAGTETTRNRLGILVLEPLLNVEPRNAQPFTYETALIAVRRFTTEGVVPVGYSTKIVLQNNDSAPEVSAGIGIVCATQDDRRQPMHFRGLLAVPGRDVREGVECWYVRFPGQSIESIRGSSPEEVIDRVYAMNLSHLAEVYEAPPSPPPQAPVQPRKNHGGHRVRPGDL